MACSTENPPLAPTKAEMLARLRRVQVLGCTSPERCTPDPNVDPLREIPIQGTLYIGGYLWVINGYNPQ